MKNNFFGKTYSDYKKLPKLSIAHDLLVMFPYVNNDKPIYVQKELPTYLHNIINNCLHDKYNIETCISNKIEHDRTYLFEMIGFHYHIQFKLNPEFEANDMMVIIEQFIKDWNNEHITYSHNMIIINKKFYDGK